MCQANDEDGKEGWQKIGARNDSGKAGRDDDFKTEDDDVK